MSTKRVYLKQSVWDAALERINWLFDEFPHVYVNMSGGKDSTVVYHLCLKVAEERGRLPLNVLFVDQEAEWDSTIEYVRGVMSDPRVSPHWLQVPLRLFNATSTEEPWLHCWEPGKEWVREKEPNSIHVNEFGTDRFAELLDAYPTWRHPGEPAVNIAGVRCEESPARLLGLTTYETYGGETWGAKIDPKKGRYAFYPIYDWSYTDVWKAIHDNGWSYSRLYDAQYQYGVPVPNMRVSNLHHETAVKNLWYLQEVEHDTWERISKRLRGINAAAQLRSDFFAPRELPYMFQDWREYRDHLLENLISDPEQKEWYRRTFASYDGRYEGATLQDLYKTEIAMILVNDYHGTKLSSFAAAHMHASKNRGVKSDRTQDRIDG